MIEEEDDDDDDFPLRFYEDLGEHTISDDIRKAFVWASITKFILDTQFIEDIDVEEYESRHRNLAKSVVFHGPFEDFDEAMEMSRQRRGVVVSPRHTWTEQSQPSWVACLAN